MPHCGYSSGMHIMGVRENCSMLEQAEQSRPISLAETKQVIIAKLIDDDRQNQLGLLRWRTEKRCDDRKQR